MKMKNVKVLLIGLALCVSSYGNALNLGGALQQVAKARAGLEKVNCDVTYAYVTSGSWHYNDVSTVERTTSNNLQIACSSVVIRQDQILKTPNVVEYYKVRVSSMLCTDALGVSKHVNVNTIASGATCSYL
jgi:hypothetical protein